jgi:hypothetical protein
MFRKRRCSECGKKLTLAEFGLCTEHVMPRLTAMIDAEEEIRTMLPSVPLDMLNQFLNARLLQRWGPNAPSRTRRVNALVDRWA